MSEAREAVLRAILNAGGGQKITREAEYRAIRREYKTNETHTDGRIELFIDRLQDYDSHVERCDEEEIAAAIERVLKERAKTHLLVPAGIPRRWLSAGIAFVADEHLDYDDLDQSQGVLTGCALAIALTGTIVLAHSQASGRRALTLIPDYHLCVVFEQQIVSTVPEAIRDLRQIGRTSPLTTISGPSATSDIEMTRVKGVHGPRTLDVILVA